MSIANNGELQKYGIKYTTKGTPYMLTNFLFRDHDENCQDIWQYDVGKEYDKLKEKWKYFHDTIEKPSPDQQEYRVTTSIMYENGGKCERNPFADAAIGFVFQDGYKYKQMFMHNMHCGARPIKLDEKGKSIKSWEGKKSMEIWNEKQKAYETQELTDKTNEGYCDYYDNNKDVKSNETQFVEKSIEKDNKRKELFEKYKQNINGRLNQVKEYNANKKNCIAPENETLEINGNCDCIEKDPYIRFCYTEEDGHVFTNIYQDDLYHRHGRLTFQNNECHVDVLQPKIASLIINLTDRDIKELALLGSSRNNKRWMRLKQIAYSMESIIKFQRDVLKKDKILFRDEEKQKMELLTLEQFKDRIIDLCEKHNRQCKKEEEKIDMDKVKFPDEQIQQSNIENKIQEKNNANITTGHDMNIIKECFHEPNHIPPKKHGRWCRFKKWFKNLFNFNYHVNNNANASYDTNVIKNDINTMIYSNM